MDDKEKQEVSDDEFEDGLRSILSPGPVDAAGRPEQIRPAPAQPEEERGRSRQELIDRLRKEYEPPAWAFLIRPAALLAVLGLLAWYVYRVFIN